MIKIKVLAIALLVAAVTPGFAGIKQIGTINGVKIYRIKTVGLFAPSSTVLVSCDPTKPGEIEVIAQTGGAGIVPSVANAGGIVGGAAVLRPARSSVNQTGGGAKATANSSSSSRNKVIVSGHKHGHGNGHGNGHNDD